MLPTRSFLVALWLLVAGPVHVSAVGPPLDLAGEWEAIPRAFMPPHVEGGPYHRLSLQFKKVERLTNHFEHAAYEFHYTGQYTQYETLRFAIDPPVYCTTPFGYPLERNDYALPYTMSVTSRWYISSQNDELYVSSITGVGVLNLPVIPSPHGDISRLIEVSYLPGGTSRPTHDAHARLFNEIYPRNADMIPTDRCHYTRFGNPADHGSLFFWKVASAPSQRNFTGNIRGQIRSENPVITARSEHEVHRAQVYLYRQDDILRGQAAGESDENYKAYLDSRRSVAAPAAIITPNKDGRFEFRSQPVFEVNSGYWKQIRYSVQVTSGETDELALDQNAQIIPGKTNVLFFLPKEVHNVVPNSSDLEVRLRHSTGLSTKYDLVADLIKLGPENYSQIEMQVRNYLNQLRDKPGGLSEAEDEAVRRAVWAERLVRDSARYADELLTLGLVGFANLLADAIGDLKRYEGEGAANAKKALEKFRTNPNPRGAGEFNVSGFNQLGPTMQQLVQRGQSIEAAEELIKLIKAFRVLLNEGLVVGGMPPAEAKNVSVAVEQVYLTLANYIKDRSARGAAKDAIKLVIKTWLDDVLKPRLYDSALPYSFTARTKPDLQFSADRLRSWNRSDYSAYVNDRDVAVDRLSRLSSAASQLIQNAILLNATAEAADASQRLFAAGSVIPPARAWTTALENLSKAVKYLSNAGSAAAPVVYIFWGGPKLVREGVYGAYGEQPPQQPAGPAEVTAAGSRLVAAASSPPPVVLPATNSLANSLKRIAALISSNQIGAAIELTGSTNTGGYLRAWNEWNEEMTLLELRLASTVADQNSSAGKPLNHLQNLKINLSLDRARFEESATDLFFKILLSDVVSTNDPVYIAGRSQVIALGNRIIDGLLDFHQTFRNLSLEVGYRPVMPLVRVQLNGPVGTTSGQTVISASEQEFKLRLRFTNLGQQGVTNAVARLMVVSSNVTVVEALNRPLPIVLQPSDDVAGGPDEAGVEWNLRYQGDLSDGGILYQVEVLEGGGSPTNFAASILSGAVDIALAILDEDLDGMPAAFERQYGLNPSADDAAADLDADGLSNIVEYRNGLRPNAADTDGDGLSDGEEMAGGEDGFVTKPLLSDTDGDGVIDSLDGNPVDASSVTAPPPANDPFVVLDRNTVTLSRFEPFASVKVSNGGKGFLVWTAASDNPAIAATNPEIPDVREDDHLLISVPSGADLKSFGAAITTVHVHDAGGANRDAQTIRVLVNGDFGITPKMTIAPSLQSVTFVWTAVADKRYEVEYSEDLLTWKKPTNGIFQPAFSGAVHQWRDQGPPGTDASPSSVPRRYYRIIPF